MAATLPPPDRAQRADARRNRERILAAARAVVAERGAETQMQDVASAAGVGVGTVYRHFATKDILMGELMSQCALENAEIARCALAAPDAWESFAGLIRGACEEMAADAAKRRLWSAVSPEAMSHAEAAKGEMRDACAAVIGRAHAANALRADFSVEDMPGLMCGLAAVIDAGSPGDWQRLVEFALDGLQAR
jgi:AcrR family transcriptional regulator